MYRFASGLFRLFLLPEAKDMLYVKLGIAETKSFVKCMVALDNIRGLEKVTYDNFNRQYIRNKNASTGENSL